MINFNTINQINDIMTILNNTRKAVNKPQSGNSFEQAIQQANTQGTVQTPAQTVQQTTVLPSNQLYQSMLNDLCCVDGCNKPARLWIKGIPYCKEHDPNNRIATEEE